MQEFMRVDNAMQRTTVKCVDKSLFADLSGSDAAVALRSFPRRFREPFLAGELSGATDAIDPRSIPVGRSSSPTSLVAGTANALGVLTKALDSALQQDRPEVGDLLDTAAKPPLAGPPDPTLPAALSQLDTAAGALADRASNTTLAQWARPATQHGKEIEAISILRHAIWIARTNLDLLPLHLTELRRGRKPTTQR